MRDGLAWILAMLMSFSTALMVGGCSGATESQMTAVSNDVAGYVARTLQPTLNSENAADQAVTIAMSQQLLTDTSTALTAAKTINPAAAEQAAQEVLDIILAIIKSGVLSNLPGVFGDSQAVMLARADVKADLVAYGKSPGPAAAKKLKASLARYQALKCPSCNPGAAK